MGITRKTRFRQDAEFVFGERRPVALQYGAPESVVLVDDAEALLPVVADDVVHQGADFLGIARPQVDEIGIPLCVAQKVGAAQDAHQRNPGVSQHGRGALRRRRSRAADQGEHVVFGGESLRVRRGSLRLVPIVERNQLKLPAAYATVSVALRKRREEAALEEQAGDPGRPRYRYGLAENDRVRAHAGRRRRERRGQQQRQRQKGRRPKGSEQSIHHRFFPPPWLFPPAPSIFSVIGLWPARFPGPLRPRAPWRWENMEGVSNMRERGLATRA